MLEALALAIWILVFVQGCLLWNEYLDFTFEHCETRNIRK